MASGEWKSIRYSLFAIRDARNKQRRQRTGGGACVTVFAKLRRSEAKRRQTQGRVLPRLAGAAAAHLLNRRGQHIYRRSTAVLAPRSLSSQGTQHQARLPATWRGHVLRIPLSGRYPPLPVPVQRRTSRSGRNAGEMMPNAARERVASPPAGAALARGLWPAGRSPSDWARFRKCM